MRPVKLSQEEWIAEVKKSSFVNQNLTPEEWSRIFSYFDDSGIFLGFFETAKYYTPTIYEGYQRELREEREAYRRKEPNARKIYRRACRCCGDTFYTLQRNQYYDTDKCEEQHKGRELCKS